MHGAGEDVPHGGGRGGEGRALAAAISSTILGDRDQAERQAYADDAALLEALDADGDGVVSRAELAARPELAAEYLSLEASRGNHSPEKARAAREGGRPARAERPRYASPGRAALEYGAEHAEAAFLRQHAEASLAEKARAISSGRRRGPSGHWSQDARSVLRSPGRAAVKVGLGRIVALFCRASASHQIHDHSQCLFF